jgi:hypothetical protein
VNPGSRSRFGSPPPGLAELKVLTDDQLMVQLQAGVNDALAVLFDNLPPSWHTYIESPRHKSLYRPQPTCRRWCHTI